MLQNKNILLVGGDLRQLYLGKLIAKNNKVFSIGIDHVDSSMIEPTTVEEIKDNIALDYIIFPMPVTNDNVTINSSSSKDILIDDILSLIDNKTCVLGGKFTKELMLKLDKMRVEHVDYLEREELAIMNAIPTAEGAIQIAMEELPITIFQSSVLVIGYGRISKILSKYLFDLGANVTVSARRFSDLAWIEANGFKTANTYKIKDIIRKFDLIINTVPVTILDEEILSCVKKDCLIIDLASKPGGIDFETAKQLGLKTIWALSLPGKVAPITAGKIIYNTINNIESERRHSLE